MRVHCMTVSQFVDPFLLVTAIKVRWHRASRGEIVISPTKFRNESFKFETNNKETLNPNLRSLNLISDLIGKTKRERATTVLDDGFLQEHPLCTWFLFELPGQTIAVYELL